MSTLVFDPFCGFLPRTELNEHFQGGMPKPLELLADIRRVRRTPSEVMSDKEQFQVTPSYFFSQSPNPVSTVVSVSASHQIVPGSNPGTGNDFFTFKIDLAHDNTNFYLILYWFYSNFFFKLKLTKNLKNLNDLKWNVGIAGDIARAPLQRQWYIGETGRQGPGHRGRTRRKERPIWSRGVSSPSAAFFVASRRRRRRHRRHFVRPGPAHRHGAQETRSTGSVHLVKSSFIHYYFYDFIDCLLDLMILVILFLNLMISMILFMILMIYWWF